MKDSTHYSVREIAEHIGGVVLGDGDRIEIYRPLIADPKEIRRQRAARGLKMKKGGGALNPD